MNEQRPARVSLLPVSRRIAALLLAASMLLPLVACGQSTEADTTAAAATTAGAADTLPETEFFPAVERKDYDGETFRMISINEEGTWVYGSEEEYNSSNKQVMNDVLYEMNTLVEDYLGISIEYEYVEHISGQSVIFDKVNPTVMSGDDVYQLCILPAYRNVASFVTQNSAMDLYELDNLDFSQSYWNREVIESLQIGDHAYLGLGDICYHKVYPVYCNKDLLAQAGRAMPYDKVRNGTWTIDEFLTISTDLYQDNGDGQVNNQDVFGFSTLWNINANCLMQASDIYVVTRFDDGGFELSMYGDRLVTLYEKLYSWSKQDDVHIWGYSQREDETITTNFLDNRVYFTIDYLDAQYLDAEFAVGILPIPKYDVAQENYSHVNWGDNICVPKTVQNREMVGEALELMSYYSETMVMTRFYDDVLQLRVSDAPDDREMVEMVFDTIVFDPGIAYCDGNDQLFNLVYLLEYCVLNNQESIASYYNRNQKTAAHFLSKNIYKTK